MFDFDNVMKAYEDNPLLKFRKLTEFEGIPRLLFGDCKSMIQNIQEHGQYLFALLYNLPLGDNLRQYAPSDFVIYELQGIPNCNLLQVELPDKNLGCFLCKRMFIKYCDGYINPAIYSVEKSIDCFMLCTIGLDGFHGNLGIVDVEDTLDQVSRIIQAVEVR